MSYSTHRNLGRIFLSYVNGFIIAVEAEHIFSSQRRQPPRGHMRHSEFPDHFQPLPERQHPEAVVLAGLRKPHRQVFGGNPLVVRLRYDPRT